MFLGVLMNNRDIGFLLFVIGVILVFISLFIHHRFRNKEKQQAGMIRFPSGYINDNALTLQAKLEQCGFTNIKMVNLHDVSLGIFKKNGEIKSILVNGHSPHPRKWLYANTPIMIEYHGR